MAAKIPYPILRCLTMEDRRQATRALYKLGFRRDGHSNVEDGVEAASTVPEREYIYPASDHGIFFARRSDVNWDRGLAIVNSLPHMIHYIKQHGLVAQ